MSRGLQNQTSEVCGLAVISCLQLRLKAFAQSKFQHANCNLDFSICHGFKFDMFGFLQVPNSEAQSSTVVVTGTAASVAEAKVGLEERMEEIKAKMADDEVRIYSNYFTLNSSGTDIMMKHLARF